MARMLAAAQRDFCPYYRSRGFGLDCPSAATTKKAARQREKRAWRREVNSMRDRPWPRARRVGRNLELAMSRTDVHRPALVQSNDPHNRREWVEWHDHRDGVCTLDRYRREGWFRGCCLVVYRGHRNVYCGCRLCTGHDDQRAERRRDRHSWRRNLERYG